MPHSKLLAALATAASFAVLPAAAQAESIVPPDNSAAIQYTETLPTSRGQKDAEGEKGKVKPAKVLGHKNVHKLEKKGKQGREVAEFAAETAPATVATVDSGGSGAAADGTTPDSSRSKGKKQPQDGGGEAASVGGGGSGSGPGGSAPNQNGGSAAAAHGSSALGEIAGQATGTSSGELGLLLPLVIVAAVAWAAAFFWRQRRRIA